MNLNQGNTGTGSPCDTMRALLSEYMDNTLSARQMWNVEKHISACPECATYLQQMQMTVTALRAAPHFDTSDDFMARLHARLDGLEPEMARAPSLSARLRDWVAGVQEGLRTQPLPRASMALALSCAAALLMLPYLPFNGVAPATTHQAATRSIPPPVQQELDRHVADVANDPLGDVAAAKLTAQASPGEDANGSEVE